MQKHSPNSSCKTFAWENCSDFLNLETCLVSTGMTYVDLVSTYFEVYKKRAVLIVLI